MRIVAALVASCTLLVGGAATAAPAKDALLLGDSVLATLGWSNEGLRLLEDRHPFILRAVSCQRLVTEGCTGRSRSSALRIMRQERGRFTRAVVVATGYNDYNDGRFPQAVRRFHEEAVAQGVWLVWVNYREAGNVRDKSAVFNATLRRLQPELPRLVVVDWNDLSRGQRTWWGPDQIHLYDEGAVAMARAIADAISALPAEFPA
ncbi:MAG: hypothetical protein EBU70_01900 [Actinobacteria bacterium]|nr:hypothetical protein [Actinomycetota bacterium]